MQPTFFEPANLPELEPAHAVAGALFETPAMAMVVILIFGAVLFLGLKAKGRAGQGVLAMGIAALVAGSMLGVSVLVTTDREVVGQRAGLLVTAVATGDQVGIRSLLDPDASLSTRFASVDGADKIVSLAVRRIPGLIKEYSVVEVRVDLPGPRVARTMVKVRVKGVYGPSVSWWMIHWNRPTVDSEEWVARHIEPIWIQGVDGAGG